jgi:hypothetical protein
VASLEFTFDLFELLEQAGLVCYEQFWNNQRCRERAHAPFQARVRQAPLFSAAFRMLSEIARWHKRDPADNPRLRVAFTKMTPGIFAI